MVLEKFRKKNFFFFGKEWSFYRRFIRVSSWFSKNLEKIFFFWSGMVILSAFHTCIIMVFEKFRKNMFFFGQEWSFYRRFIRVSSWFSKNLEKIFFFCSGMVIISAFHTFIIMVYKNFEEKKNFYFSVKDAHFMGYPSWFLKNFEKKIFFFSKGME